MHSGITCWPDIAQKVLSFWGKPADLGGKIGNFPSITRSQDLWELQTDKSKVARAFDNQ